MSVTLITALTGLVTAIVPVIGALLSYRLKKMEFAQEQPFQDGVKADTISQFYQSEKFVRLILSCIIVFAITGAATALIGVIDNWDGNAIMHKEKDFCWLVGNLTVLFMGLRHAFTSR